MPPSSLFSPSSSCRRRARSRARGSASGWSRAPNGSTSRATRSLAPMTTRRRRYSSSGGGARAKRATASQHVSKWPYPWRGLSCPPPAQWTASEGSKVTGPLRLTALCRPPRQPAVARRPRGHGQGRGDRVGAAAAAARARDGRRRRDPPRGARRLPPAAARRRPPRVPAVGAISMVKVAVLARP